MKEIVYSETRYKNFMITLIYDSDPPNPRVYEDNITKIICFHKRYNLGDKHNYRSNDFNNWGEFKDKLIEEEKAIKKLGR